MNVPKKFLKKLIFLQSSFNKSVLVYNLKKEFNFLRNTQFCLLKFYSILFIKILLRNFANG